MDKRVALVLWLIVVSFVVTPVFAGNLFETDFAKAAEAAKGANRYMLVDFTGSDWCGWCIKLDKEVFAKKAFKSYADRELVCIMLDFPRKKSLKKSLKKQNQELSAKYKVRGFPTVLILSPNGDLVARTGYQQGGPEKYVDHLKKLIDPHRKKNKVPKATAIQKGGSNKKSLKASRPKPLAKDENREMREWKSKAGAAVTASVVREMGPYVVLKRKSGETVRILASQLSDADRKYIEELKKKEASTPTGK